MTMNNEAVQPSRRTVVKGIAWSVPAVTVAGAAPAFAASPEPIYEHVTTWRWYSNNYPGCGNNNRDGLEINTTEGTRVAVTGARTTTSPYGPRTTITDVTARFWFTRNDITWSAATGNSGCWTVPTQTDAGNSVDIGGRRYYPYISNYTCPITVPTTPVNGFVTVELQPYRFRSQCFNVGDSAWAGARWVRRTTSAMVDGVVQPLDTGGFQIES